MLCGVRFAPRSPVEWVEVDADVQSGDFVIVARDQAEQVARVIVATDQLRGALADVTPVGQILRPASPDEAAQWGLAQPNPRALPDDLNDWLVPPGSSPVVDDQSARGQQARRLIDWLERDPKPDPE